MSMKKILLLYAHPTQCRSEVNQPLFEAASKMKGVTAVDLYGDYPTFNINIEKEQKRLIEHDIIIFQFPLFWYSAPAILKEWQDLVLEYGFAYGRSGNALKQKTFFCSLTAGGKEDAYQNNDNHFTIRQLLYPFEQMAKLTGMRYLPPFTLFGARTAVEDNRVGDHISQWETLLTALMKDNLDLNEGETLETLDAGMNSIVQEDRS